MVAPAALWICAAATRAADASDSDRDVWLRKRALTADAMTTYCERIAAGIERVAEPGQKPIVLVPVALDEPVFDAWGWALESQLVFMVGSDGSDSAKGGDGERRDLEWWWTWQEFGGGWAKWAGALRHETRGDETPSFLGLDLRGPSPRAKTLGVLLGLRFGVEDYCRQNGGPPPSIADVGPGPRGLNLGIDGWGAPIRVAYGVRVRSRGADGLPDGFDENADLFRIYRVTSENGDWFQGAEVVALEEACVSKLLTVHVEISGRRKDRLVVGLAKDGIVAMRNTIDPRNDCWFENVPDGRLSICLMEVTDGEDAKRALRLGSVTVRDGARETPSFMVFVGVVKGRVSGPDGRPVRERRVRLRFTNGGEERFLETATDGEGVFRFGIVPMGRTILEVDPGPGTSGFTEPIEVEPGSSPPVLEIALRSA